MHRLEREDYVAAPYRFLWALLGLQAGYINAFGFLSCGRYVSHVTGVGTQIGVAIAHQQSWVAYELIGFPISFILGAFVNGVLTSVRLERGDRPRFDLVTLAIPAIFFFLVIAGTVGTFGTFGEELLLTRDFVLLFLLSFVCGMQNGCFAVMTKGQIRTTHLTGISTDIGTDVSRLWFGNLSKKEFELVRRTNLSRFGTFAAFGVGSVVAVLLGNRYEYDALVVPFFTSIFVYVAVKRISRRLDQRQKRGLRAAS